MVAVGLPPPPPSYYDAKGVTLRTVGVARIAVHGAEDAAEGSECKLGMNVYVRWPLCSFLCSRSFAEGMPGRPLSGSA